MTFDSTQTSAQYSGETLHFNSRRSVVYSAKGIIACTQPLAAQCGLKVLQAGGNAADAAVAVAAGLNMTEPASTGIGGDMFMLYYDAITGKVSALNGSGRSGEKYTLERTRRDLGLAEDTNGLERIPMTSVHAVTVPGAAAGWVDAVEQFGSGKVSLEDILMPAIELGESGFPWVRSEELLRRASPNFAEILKNDPKGPGGVRAPLPGDLMKNPKLAQTFRTLGTHGKRGFYTGRIAEAIIAAVTARGGHLTLADLEHHMTTAAAAETAPLSLRFSGQGLGAKNETIDLWEHPPNGQGIVALMALGIIQELEKQGKIPKWAASNHNTAPYLHVIIESLRLAFSDGTWFVSDPATTRVPTTELLSSEYLSSRAKLFKVERALSAEEVIHGLPDTSTGDSPALNSCDTVYFCVTDSAGNAASFINSNYGNFGAGIVPAGCGFALQNRAANFSLNQNHPNVLAPRKRPYHTIIPGLVTHARDGTLHSAFGVMGGFMQPQGQLQVLLGQIVGGLDPQAALDAPRICIDSGTQRADGTVNWRVSVEDGMPQETIEGLKRLGHEVSVLKGFQRELFGRGQIIKRTVDAVEGTCIWSAGSDPRGDGAAYPIL
ncbi:putative gamma-glutamyltransferase YwrD [Ceratocystis fimbriata CBS 114723]|uniref:Putative gamma-glutamyltransferase YwrD n=1 Tax=Ceratocystis fimbriata CBS 114723 TaxID=1035309 RepID=A0A2C5X223_9PEZI|nr:putative gamma-glutamyltransferase YwrD [Ceratocystis fimbriata CBS 114723]